MTTIITISPSKAILLNNKIEYYQKSVFFYANLRTFQLNCYHPANWKTRRDDSLLVFELTIWKVNLAYLA